MSFTVAIVGRPNVGKSTLFNRLIADKRLLTGPEPGLTRDAVAVAWEWQGRRIELVDTAGLRRRARIEPGALEQLSSKSALAALRQADVVVLMVDASAPLEQQDVTIANRAADAGRALVMAANKWDLVEEPQAALALLRERLDNRLPHLKGIACLPMSVSTGTPTFVLFVSQAGALPETYLRYLTNSLREAFDLAGVPLRLRPRSGKNPYV